MRRLERTRRDFCVCACHAASLAAVGSVLQGCGGSPTEPSTAAPALPITGGSVNNNTLSITIDASSPLFAIGSATLVQSSLGNFLVAHTALDTFVALTAICTHESCLITGVLSGLYTCPCHGSQFNTSGAVVTGPAATPLAQKATQFVSGVLTITI